MEQPSLLEIRNLSVGAGGRTILEDISLEVAQGKVLALFGPNGSGKTSLIMAIMGFSGYTVLQGEILFKGRLMNGLSIDERARAGMGIMLQKPPGIRGVKTRQVAKLASSGGFDLEGTAEKMGMTELLDRDVNLNFSGGEIKRSEVMQLMAQSPDMALLDEPESGVDLENIQLVGMGINSILGRDKREGTGKSGLIITHTGFILDYVEADCGCVMLDKKLHCMGDPKRILNDIRKSGYEKCVQCRKIRP